MIDSNSTTSSMPPVGGNAPEPRWSAWTPFLTSWLLPATTARRTARASLSEAYRVHLTSAAMTVPLVMFVSACLNVQGPASLTSIRADLLDMVAGFVLDLQSNPKGAFLMLVLVFAILFEVAFTAVALLVMPWGARDEPIRSSYRHALGRTWLHTTHLIPIVLLIGGVAVARDRFERNWWGTHELPSSSYRLPVPPELAPDDPGYAKALEDYEAAVRRGRRQSWERVRQVQVWLPTVPWYVWHSEALTANLCLAAGVWVLWALLRAVGVPRPVPQIARPPRCEACGYNLTGLPMDGRCPECGEAVSLSLGPEARAGTTWQRRGELGRLTAWWRGGVEAILHPTRLGRQVPLMSPVTDHRRFFVLHVPLILYLGSLGSITCALLAVGIDTMTIYQKADFPGAIFVAAPVFACSSVILVVALSNLGALAASVGHRFREPRNLMPGAIQVACYLSGYLTLLVGVAAAWGAMVLIWKNEGVYRGWAQFLHVGEGMLAFYSWLAPNIIGLVVYFALVARGTEATRYANR